MTFKLTNNIFMLYYILKHNIYWYYIFYHGYLFQIYLITWAGSMVESSVRWDMEGEGWYLTSRAFFNTSSIVMFSHVLIDIDNPLNCKLVRITKCSFLVNVLLYYTNKKCLNQFSIFLCVNTSWFLLFVKYTDFFLCTFYCMKIRYQ